MDGDILVDCTLSFVNVLDYRRNLFHYSLHSAVVNGLHLLYDALGDCISPGLVIELGIKAAVD